MNKKPTPREGTLSFHPTGKTLVSRQKRELYPFKGLTEDKPTGLERITLVGDLGLIVDPAKKRRDTPFPEIDRNRIRFFRWY